MPSSTNNNDSGYNDFSDAKAALATYRDTCTELFGLIQSTINSLTQSGFIGDAAIGYASYVDQVVPKISTKLTGESDSVTSLLNELITLAEQLIIIESS